MEALYKLKFGVSYVDTLDGLFIADKKYIDYLIQSKISVDFGEAWGEHSEVCGPVEENEVIFVTDDPEVIAMVRKHNLTIGYNPLEFHIGYDTPDVPDNGVDWYDCTVEEFIDFKLDGTIPEYYKEKYEKWLNGTEDSDDSSDEDDDMDDVDEEEDDEEDWEVES